MSGKGGNWEEERERELELVCKKIYCLKKIKRETRTGGVVCWEEGRKVYSRECWEAAFTPAESASCSWNAPGASCHSLRYACHSEHDCVTVTQKLLYRETYFHMSKVSFTDLSSLGSKPPHIFLFILLLKIIFPYKIYFTSPISPSSSQPTFPFRSTFFSSPTKKWAGF